MPVNWIKWIFRTMRSWVRMSLWNRFQMNTTLEGLVQLPDSQFEIGQCHNLLFHFDLINHLFCLYLIRMLECTLDVVGYRISCSRKNRTRRDVFIFYSMLKSCSNHSWGLETLLLAAFHIWVFDEVVHYALDQLPAVRSDVSSFVVLSDHCLKTFSQDKSWSNKITNINVIYEVDQFISFWFNRFHHTSSDRACSNRFYIFCINMLSRLFWVEVYRINFRIKGIVQKFELIT